MKVIECNFMLMSDTNVLDTGYAFNLRFWMLLYLNSSYFIFYCFLSTIDVFLEEIIALVIKLWNTDTYTRHNIDT